jgi:hypothetical protein
LTSIARAVPSPRRRVASLLAAAFAASLLAAPAAAPAHVISAKKANAALRAYGLRLVAHAKPFSPRVTKKRNQFGQEFCRPVPKVRGHSHRARCYYMGSLLEWLGPPRPGSEYPDEWAHRFCDNPGASKDQRKRAQVVVSSSGRLRVVKRTVLFRCRLFDILRASKAPRPQDVVEAPPAVVPPAYASEADAPPPQQTPPEDLGRPSKDEPDGAPTGPPGSGRTAAFRAFGDRDVGAFAAQAAGDGSYFHGCTGWTKDPWTFRVFIKACFWRYPDPPAGAHPNGYTTWTTQFWYYDGKDAVFWFSQDW